MQRVAARIRAIVLILLASGLLQVCGQSTLEPIFSEDLRPLGFVGEKQGFWVYNSNDLAFLSDDLVLVSLNRREYAKTAGFTRPQQDPQPPATLLLFSIGQKKLIRSMTHPLAKHVGSVRALQHGYFVLLHNGALEFCSSDLRCSERGPARGELELIASPKAQRLVAGGTLWKLQYADSVSRSLIPSFRRYVIPGDRDLLVCRDNKLFISSDERDEREIGPNQACYQLKTRFLNDETVADLRGNDAVLLKLDGTLIHKIPVKDVFGSTSFVPSASGSRFLINELAFTRWNSAANFMDFDLTRPRNFKRVRVFDIASGKLVFAQEWDPHRYEPDGDDDLPALSPDGHRVALMKRGVLEVYEIP